MNCKLLLHMIVWLLNIFLNVVFMCCEVLSREQSSSIVWYHKIGFVIHYVWKANNSVSHLSIYNTHFITVFTHRLLTLRHVIFSLQLGKSSAILKQFSNPGLCRSSLFPCLPRFCIDIIHMNRELIGEEISWTLTFSFMTLLGK